MSQMRFISEELHDTAKANQRYLSEGLTREVKVRLHAILRPHLRNRTVCVHNYDRLLMYVNNRTGNPTAYDLSWPYFNNSVCRLFKVSPELKKALDRLNEEIDSFGNEYGVYLEDFTLYF